MYNYLLFIPSFNNCTYTISLLINLDNKSINSSYLCMSISYMHNIINQCTVWNFIWYKGGPEHCDVMYL